MKIKKIEPKPKTKLFYTNFLLNIHPEIFQARLSSYLFKIFLEFNMKTIYRFT